MVLPFENDNLKIMKTLAKRSFMASRFRNLVAVLAIALTAVLFTSVTTIGTGTMESLKTTMQMQKMSRSDADIRYLTKEQYEKLEASGMAKEMGLRMPIGFLTNTERHSIELDLADATQRKLTFCQPTNGEEPNAANEIVASDRALEELGAEPAVGAKVTIEFTAHGKKYQLPMVVSGWYESLNSELSVMMVSESFQEEYPEIFEYTYREDGELAGTYWSDFMMKDKKYMTEQMKQFVISIGGGTEMTDPNYVAAVINQETNPAMDGNMLAAIAVMGVLFVFCGYLLIYNVFDIAVMQEIRRYGLYRTIGMSKKQVKHLINKQAVWVSCLGIPVGLLCGFFIGKMTLPVIMDILSTDYKNIVITVSPNPLIFVAAAILTALTVFISTRKPIRMAAGTSPLEAFRYVERDGKKKKGKLKKRSTGVNLWKMAVSNLGRNKRRCAFIIISLMLSVMMLNAVGTAAGSVNVERQVQEMIRTDFEITGMNTTSNMKGYIKHEHAVSDIFIQAVKEQPGIKEGSVVYKNTLEDTNVTFDYGTVVSGIEEQDEQGVRVMIGHDSASRYIPVGNDEYPLCNVYGMERAGLERLDIQEGEQYFDTLYEKLMSGEGVILGVPAERKTREFEEVFNYLNVGDTITARINGMEMKTYTILAKAALTADDEGFGFSVSSSINVGGDAPYLYMPQEEYKELYEKPSIMKYTFNVEEESRAEMTQFLESYVENTETSMAYLSADAARANAESTRTMIYLVGGIIACIFGITGILNLINMMSTSILARRREFATMQSIGMTKKQLKKLLMLEGCCYASGAAVLGTLGAVVMNTLLIRTILEGPSMWQFSYQMTLIPAIVLSVILIGVSALIPGVAMRMFYKGSVVEQLREGE